MPGRRVLAIGLDGLEVHFAERLMAAGEMPALAALRARGARFLLDHGSAQRTGLGWEHFASGLSPDAGRRWAGIEFDAATYATWQAGARFAPWWAGLDRRVVVFDTPYVDLRRCPGTRGIVAWGAHDPGTLLTARPGRLRREFIDKFGRYPSEWMYATPWPSPARAQGMGRMLAQALETRARAGRWLATERLADWDLFIVVAGETHGAVEGLWHGVDPAHPLYKHPSAPAAGQALREVHRALDRMVAEITTAVGGDVATVAFTMGGMGPNHSDVQSMVLLAELLYRDAFGRTLLSVPRQWRDAPAEAPWLDEDDHWGRATHAWVPVPRAQNSLHATLRSFVHSRPRLRAGLKAARAAVAAWRSQGPAGVTLGLEWQPAQRYRAYWPSMEAFALPSYYDGRIRVNLRGRERRGIVEPSRYEEVCRRIEALVRESRNALTGEPAVEAVERASTRDPFALAGSESDLLVVWRGVATALQHPRLGLVGPVALHRTGGHTGSHGVAYIAAPGVRSGDYGVRSSFDVAPTVAKLLGCVQMPDMSGTSLLA
jgi:predicted AlkP superfamily phosphohydrolase/phosphomutase